MDIQIKTFQNKKQELTEGVFIGTKLIYSLAGFAQVRRGIIAHSRELGDRLGWLYIVLILLARPIGKDKGTLEISLKVLAQIMGKSLSQITRDLKDLARHKNKYILYQKAKGRYSRLAKIIIPKYPVDKSIDISTDFCIDDKVTCRDAKVENGTSAKNGEITCIDAEVEVNSPNKINEIQPANNILITEKNNKSLITKDGNICEKILFIICLSAIKDFNLDIKSQELKTVVNRHCNHREIRGWCCDPESCYLQVYSVIEKMGRYKVSDHSRYFRASLDNFLNENAEMISQKAKAANYAQEGKENF